MSYGLIYKITNVINSKCYVGQTINSIKERFQRHISDSKNPERSFYLHRAIHKYGAENFTIEPIFECVSQEEMDEKEKIETTMT